MVEKSPPAISEWATLQTITPLSTISDQLVNLNVNNRLPSSPNQGFGALRLRTYRVPLPDIRLAPAQLMDQWIINFTNFWPKGNQFFTSGGEIKPGVTGLINLSLPGGLKLYTGAVVMHVGDESFSLMTLQGHMFGGWITFSAYVEDGILYAQTQALIRPNDPLYELTFLLGLGPQAEDKFWHSSLKNLAKFFGVQGQVEQENQTIDTSYQWKYFGNLWYNAAIRSVLHQVKAAFRSTFKPVHQGD